METVVACEFRRCIASYIDSIILSHDFENSKSVRISFRKADRLVKKREKL